MNNLRNIVGLTLLFVHSIESQGLWATKGENPESPLQMLGQGKMSTGASYGHLQFPIKLKAIEQSFDDLEDIVGSYERHAMYGGAAKALRHSMSRLSTKVSMIRGMVVPGALHLALEEDNVDLIEEALNRQQYLHVRRGPCLQFRNGWDLQGSDPLVHRWPIKCIEEGH